MSNHQALLQKLATARPSNKGSDIVDGQHILALIDFSFRDTDDHGTMIGVDFEVVQSSVMPAGMKVRDGFWISKSDQNGGSYEVERAMHFVNALTGHANPNDGENSAKQSGALAQPTQPGRGLLIKVTASTKKDVPYGKRSPKRGQVRDVHERFYEHVPDQTQQAAIRAQLDAKYPLTAVVAPPPVQPAPAAYGYAVPLTAPIPAGFASPPATVAPGYNPYGQPPPAAAPAQPAYQWPATPPAGWPPGMPYPPRQ